jgi:hypothetical protein
LRLKAKSWFLGFLAAAVVIVGVAPALAAGEMVVSASGETAPTKLGRSHATPATLRVGFTSEERGNPAIPDLSAISLQISRNVSFETAGLPSCRLKDLYSPTANARQVCAGSLVGQGRVASEISLPGQAPASVEGELLAFYSSVKGTRRILAQVRTEGPVALTYVLAFRIEEKVGGRFETTFYSLQKSSAFECDSEGNPPGCAREPYTYNNLYGHISRFEMSLHRSFFHAGARHSFVTARCPARSNSRQATFPLARIALGYFSTIEEPTATATGRCEAVTD